MRTWAGAVLLAAAAALALATFYGGPPDTGQGGSAARMGHSRIPGDPGALLKDAMPDFLPRDPAWDASGEPAILLQFTEDATVGDANRILSDLDARVTSGMVFGLTLTITVRSGAGEALRWLGRHPKVAGAAASTDHLASPEALR